MPRTRIFTVRDRRALTAVLTAGLRHTDIDTIIHSHPVPGDPGHDAGKAGRVGLLTATLLASGQAQGLFRLDISARDLYLLIAANGYFYMSNRHTLSAFLGEDLEAPEALAHWEEFVVDTVLRAVAPTSASSSPPTSPLALTS